VSSHVSKIPIFLLGASLALAACAPAILPERPDLTAIPEAQREFRGAWIASVANIDWPSRPGLSTGEQQAELRGLLDRAVMLNLNAIVLQIRPTGDAFYDSPYEPWSFYLTGRQGVAPEPYYDPLAFAVEEAHRRGLELHAWFNPYRAFHPTTEGELAANHISRTHPEVVHQYGTLLWMDPAEPVVVEHTMRVILDVVRRYDIDGVHLDDYFYPYPVRDEEGERVEFPDSLAWARALDEGVTLSRDDWRRKNVDDFVERLYREVKEIKPWVKVGISPFGIWRPGHPEGVVGFDQYQEIYADARKWQREGWLDYFAPQLYWRIASPGQSYPALLGWWVEQNAAGRHLWPGNYASRVGFEERGDPAWETEEIVEQIRLTRAQPGATGNILFSIKWLRDEAAPIGEHLASTVYAEPALVPPSPWLDDSRPSQPELLLYHLGDDAAVAITPGAGDQVRLWVVRERRGAHWSVELVPAWRMSHHLAKIDGRLPDEVVISAVDRLGNEGRAARLPIAGTAMMRDP
jgi:uncharacterized lipoprotein YddW (UPF0748 family)